MRNNRTDGGSCLFWTGFLTLTCPSGARARPPRTSLRAEDHTELSGRRRGRGVVPQIDIAFKANRAEGGDDCAASRQSRARSEGVWLLWHHQSRRFEVPVVVVQRALKPQHHVAGANRVSICGRCALSVAGHKVRSSVREPGLLLPRHVLLDYITAGSSYRLCGRAERGTWFNKRRPPSIALHHRITAASSVKISWPRSLRLYNFRLG